MQEIPLQGYFACCPGLRAPCAPLCLPLLSTPSPPSASPPALAHRRDSRCGTDVGREGRAGSPPSEVGWMWGRGWRSWAWVGTAGEEGRPRGRRSTGCLWRVARGSQRRAGADTRRSGRIRWAAAAGEGWGRREGSRLPQSGRSTQRRWRGPQGTRTGGGSEGGAGGRWSADYGSAFKFSGSVDGGIRKERKKREWKKEEEKKWEMRQNHRWVWNWTEENNLLYILQRICQLPEETHWCCAAESSWQEGRGTPTRFWRGVVSALPRRWRGRCLGGWCRIFCLHTSSRPLCESAWSSLPGGADVADSERCVNKCYQIIPCNKRTQVFYEPHLSEGHFHHRVPGKVKSGDGLSVLQNLHRDIFLRLGFLCGGKELKKARK